MKNLLQLSAGLLVLGVLGAAACSGCPPPEEADTGSTYQQPSMTCGSGTHREGNQCVGNNSSSSSNTRQQSTLR